MSMQLITKTRMTTSISSEDLWNYIKDIWKMKDGQDNYRIDTH